MKALSFLKSSTTLFFIATFFACKKDSQQAPDNIDNVTVSAFAGSGTDGYADGIGIAAKFFVPTGIAADAQGNIYVAEAGNNRIRKITPTGTVSTLAGSGARGHLDGTGSMAEFSGPDAVATDSQGNVYVAEGFFIRKVSPAGEVSTIAGGSTAGFADGPISSAKFYYLKGIVIDAQNNIYVSDYGNRRIRKISSSGIVSTVAGNGSTGFADGNGTSAQFAGPEGIAIDNQGNLIVADEENARIRKITSSGEVSTLASIGQTGLLGWGPRGVTVDARGNIFVSGGGYEIRKITAAGDLSIFAGSSRGYVDGGRGVAQFDSPFGITLDALGNVYVGEYRLSLIRKISTK